MFKAPTTVPGSSRDPLRKYRPYIKQKMTEYEDTLKQEFVPDWEADNYTREEIEEEKDFFRKLHQEELEYQIEVNRGINRLEDMLSPRSGSEPAKQVADKLATRRLSIDDITFLVIETQKLLTHGIQHKALEQIILEQGHRGVANRQPILEAEQRQQATDQSSRVAERELQKKELPAQQRTDNSQAESDKWNALTTDSRDKKRSRSDDTTSQSHPETDPRKKAKRTEQLRSDQKNEDDEKPPANATTPLVP